ncbi:MAG: type II secretion system protein [Gloeobacteraceae cyanobacterium ES-bin-144]|nr:type II secretion system protein [Verrucomicrobiales bacterium]
MKIPATSRSRGFTLLETVIAIGVLAVLLTGFMIVFAPAAAGIKRSIKIQEADRLTSTLEQELVTLRSGQATATIVTGFDKAFDWIQKSNTATDALMIYQYRGDLSKQPRTDGTLEPLENIKDKTPGKDYAVQAIVRRKSDTTLFTADLKALEGGVYYVKCTQLGFEGGTLALGDLGKIVDPKLTSPPKVKDRPAILKALDYPEAVIAFAADFYALPATSAGYFGSSGRFDTAFAKTGQKPIFTRNLAVRR